MWPITLILSPVELKAQKRLTWNQLIMQWSKCDMIQGIIHHNLNMYVCLDSTEILWRSPFCIYFFLLNILNHRKCKYLNFINLKSGNCIWFHLINLITWDHTYGWYIMQFFSQSSLFKSPYSHFSKKGITLTHFKPHHDTCLRDKIKSKQNMELNESVLRTCFAPKSMIKL